MPTEKKSFARSEAFTIYSPADLSKKWFISYYHNGQRQRVYGTINQHTTYEARMQAARQLQAQLEAQQPQNTLYQKIDTWISAQRWRPKSQSTYRSIAIAYQQYCGSKPTTERTTAFFAHIRSTKSGATYDKYRQKLSQMLTAVQHENLIGDIPTQRFQSEPARYFQRYQIQQLSAAIQAADSELWLFVQFIYYTFIRPRELRQLRASHLLLDDGRIYIPGYISKNKKSEYVAIPDAFLPHLQRYRTFAPNDLLFSSAADASKPIGENTMYAKHQKILKQLGYPKGYTLYSWKHTGAIAAVKAGIGVKALQIQLRHHSLDQVNAYLRQMGFADLDDLRTSFPSI